MNVKKLQTVMFVVSGLFLLPFVAQKVFFAGAFEFVAGAIYVCALIAVGTTKMRYLREQRTSLPVWRRLPYGLALCLLGFFCVLPLVTWPLTSSGALLNLHLRPVIIALFAAHIAAAILSWFGRGWSRLGLTLVNYWLCFLWCLPLTLQE